MIKFKRINGWSYRTSDDKFIISNCGTRQWFSAEVDAESSARHGFLIALENTKMYHTTLGTAQDWVRFFNYKEKENA
jgi:hypothetical protein